MANLDDSGKVLIIGAGLGGLALAQVLHNHCVSFELFERDEAPSARKQGWAVALIECVPTEFLTTLRMRRLRLTSSGRSITAMKELLPGDFIENLITTSVNHNTGDDDEITFVNAVTGEIVGKVGGVPYGLPGSIIRAGREALRAYLWHAENLPITAGKQFIRYDEDESGVTAWFADGSSERGSLLVGADGLHSYVRSQLLADSAQKPVQSQYVPIFGELDLPPEQFEGLRRIANAAVATSGPGLRQLIGMLSMEKDGSKAHYFWALMLRRDDPTVLADWVGKASPQELYDFAIKSSQHLHPTMKGFIRYGGPEAMTQPQPKFQELVPPDTLPSGRVTLLGDAAHAMIPLRGAGANTAILDACDLAKLLIEARAGAQEPMTVIMPYVAKMIPRGKEAVLASRAAGNADNDDPAAYLKKFQRERKQNKE